MVGNRISNGAWQKYCAFSVGTASIINIFTVDLSLIGPAYATLLGFKASVTYIPNGNYTILSATNLIITIDFTSTASTQWTMYIATTGM